MDVGARAFSRALVSLAVVVVMLVLAPGAWAARGHTFVFSFGAAGSGDGQLNEPYGVAVNEATGDLYVADRGNNRVEIFDREGHYVGQFNGSGELSGEGKAAGSGGLEWEVPSGRFEGPTEIAVDNSCNIKKLTGSTCAKEDPSNEDVYVIDGGHFVVDKYTAKGEYIGQITQTPAGGRFQHTLAGVAVAPDGTVHVAALFHGDFIGARVFTFDAQPQNGCGGCVSGEFAPFRAGTVLGFLGPGLAVDGADDVYINRIFLGEPDVVLEYEKGGGFVNEINEAPGALAVEQSNADLYVSSAGHLTRYAATGNVIERFEQGGPGASGSAAAEGLAVNSVEGTVYASSASGNAIEVFPLEPPGPPTVSGSGVSQVTSDSARVEAEVNPHGAATDYRVEYGKCASSAPGGCVGSGFDGVVPVPDAFAGSGFEVEPVSLVVGGLAASATYHFRVVASNEVGGHENVVEGEERSFTTEPEGEAAALPDGRVWELVSPAYKHGALIQPIGEQGVAQAAAGGDALTYLADTPTEADPAGYTNQVQVLSHRAAGGGWSSRDIATPHVAPTGQSTASGEEYRLFSEDLSAGVVQPFGAFTSLAAGASESTAYLRANTGAGANGFCGEGCYRPLVAGCPEAGEPCAKAVQEAADVPAGSVFGLDDLTGSACGEKTLICGPTAVAATPDLSAVVLESQVGLTAGTSGGLYEWHGGRIYYVGTGVGNGEERLVVAVDGGGRVVFGKTDGSVPLRMVDPLTGEATQLDAAEQGCGTCQSGGGERAWVSADGNRLFFRDKHRLTAGSGKGFGDLYVCESPASEVKCALRDLTPEIAGEEANVLGVLGISQDGSSVYFVANGKLGSNTRTGECTEGTAQESGECNLYVMHRGGAGWGAPVLVGALSGVDKPDWVPRLNAHTARVSADGEWLAFMSERSLTGYDNRDAAHPAHLDEEVYLYHAANGGSLVCASCNPTGERPHGEEYAQIDNKLAGGQLVWPDRQWIGANVPGWTPFELQQSDYQSRYLLDSGRLFFNSSDALAPQDVNGTEDVYEYEPPGVGGCTSASATYSGRAGGCVSLISSGESPNESAFLDASASGGDVFFLTSQPLTSEDHDAAVDVYDAHQCTSSAPCPPPVALPAPECDTEVSCRAAPTPQPAIFGAPASATFTGPGNLTPATTGGVSTKAAKAKPKAGRSTKKRRRAKAPRACRKRSKGRRAACSRGARRARTSNAKGLSWARQEEGFRR
ncbi:MAG TPA: hypothetical protein VGY76_11040 [Solirubrobacteraceae bacterium]|nr:hypothetical protein [Solirubrobacteraceae bacterium]